MFKRHGFLCVYPVWGSWRFLIPYICVSPSLESFQLLFLQKFSNQDFFSFCCTPVTQTQTFWYCPIGFWGPVFVCSVLFCSVSSIFYRLDNFYWSVFEFADFSFLCHLYSAIKGPVNTVLFSSKLSIWFFSYLLLYWEFLFTFILRVFSFTLWSIVIITVLKPLFYSSNT